MHVYSKQFCTFDIRSIDSVIIITQLRERIIPQITEPVQPQFSGIITQNNIRAVTIMSGISSIDKLFSCYHGKNLICNRGYTAGCFIPGKPQLYKPSVVRIIKDNRWFIISPYSICRCNDKGSNLKGLLFSSYIISR